MIHSAKACFIAAAAMIAGGNRPSLTEARAEREGGIWALGNKFKTRFCRNIILHNNGQPHGVSPMYIEIILHFKDASADTIRPYGNKRCIYIRHP